MDYKEVTLYGRKIRVYSGEHIEMEFRERVGDFRKIKMFKDQEYNRVRVKENGITHNVAVHRLVFYAHNPAWDIYNSSTDNSIDHINEARSDNRIENLQCVTNQENQFKNSKAKGYYWNKYKKKWIASICLNRKTILLGNFNEESDAREAYLVAKLKYHIIEERVF